MKCEQCDSEATVHELRVVNGKRVERHLCEKCARNEGIAVQAGMSVPEMIEKMLEQSAPGTKTPPGAKPKAEPAKTTSCATCGTTYPEFRQSGLLGCPDCYKAFEPQLGPLLERAHEGGTHHVGKIPRRALSGVLPTGPARAAEAVLGEAAQRASKITALRKQLDEAVQAEQYERAAAIRDELRRLTELAARHAPSPSSGPPHSPTPPPATGQAQTD